VKTDAVDGERVAAEGNADTVPLTSLVEAVSDAESVDDGRERVDADGGPGGGPAAAVRRVKRELFPDRDFRFDEPVVKENLDDILLFLVALRDSDTHGKQLMEDLSWLFDARLSPGTVYPELHDLDGDDLLMVHEKVRTKEYKVADDEELRRQLRTAVRQHLALALVLSTAV
jgi:hypothetical protein